MRETSRLVMAPLCLIVLEHVRLAIIQIFTDPSSEPLANIVPSINTHKHVTFSLENKKQQSKSNFIVSGAHTIKVMRSYFA